MGYTNDNNQRRNQSCQDGDFITEPADKTESPNDPQLLTTSSVMNVARKERKKKKKINAVIPKASPTNMPISALMFSEFYGSDVWHTRDPNIDVVGFFKLLNNWIELLENKIFTNFGVYDITLEIESCLNSLRFFV